MSRAIARSSLIHMLPPHLELMGIDAASIFRQAGMGPDHMVSPLIVRRTQIHTALGLAARAAGQAEIALSLGAAAEPAKLGPPGLAMLAGQSLEACLRGHLALMPRLQNDCEHRLWVEGQSAIFSHRLVGDGQTAWLLYEGATAFNVQLIRQILGVNWAPELITFPHACRGRRAAYEAHFGGPVVFGIHADARIYFPKALLSATRKSYPAGTNAPSQAEMMPIGHFCLVEMERFDYDSKRLFEALFPMIEASLPYIAFVDACAHQANDFQIKDAFWKTINTTSSAFNDEGRFVTFPGYEWSANTAAGGDHNVFFRDEGRPIIRSSHAMIEDRHRLKTDANDLPALYAALAKEDCVLFAHVGGRPANLAAAHDSRLRVAVELHSDWGTFEWMLHDSFRLGYRVGVVCNSDGHKGRPGASYPGAASFGALGGLTCFRAAALDRDGLFDAIRRRSHYGTTGSRLHMDVHLAFDAPAEIFHLDPAAGARPHCASYRAEMGEIARTSADAATVSISVLTGSPILSIDLFTASDIAATFRSYTRDDLGNRLRILCNGAEYRGRGRQTLWNGTVTFSDAAVARITPINWWNPERPLDHDGAGRIRFETVTTGNFVGFDAALDRLRGTVNIVTNVVTGSFDPTELGIEARVLDAGGLDRAISVQRLPDRLEATEMTVSHRVRLKDEGDTPVWVRVCTEDGHVAWSSPIYVIR